MELAWFVFACLFGGKISCEPLDSFKIKLLRKLIYNRLTFGVNLKWPTKLTDFTQHRNDLNSISLADSAQHLCGSSWELYYLQSSYLLDFSSVVQLPVFCPAALPVLFMPLAHTRYKNWHMHSTGELPEQRTPRSVIRLRMTRMNFAYQTSEAAATGNCFADEDKY